MDTRNTNERTEIAAARRPDVDDWSALTTGERVRYLELEGYLVLPDLLDAGADRRHRRGGGRVAAYRRRTTRRTRRRRTICSATSCLQTMETIALPPTIAFLERLFGDEVLFTSIAYQLCEPGHPGIAIHTDAQPYGSRIFGSLASSPVLMRVLYYLDDLTPECSPFKVVPRSHLSVHFDANPYNRFLPPRGGGDGDLQGRGRPWSSTRRSSTATSPTSPTATGACWRSPTGLPGPGRWPRSTRGDESQLAPVAAGGAPLLPGPQHAADRLRRPQPPRRPGPQQRRHRTFALERARVAHSPPRFGTREAPMPAADAGQQQAIAAALASLDSVG